VCEALEDSHSTVRVLSSMSPASPTDIDTTHVRIIDYTARYGMEDLLNKSLECHL
jgi:hypothetical protein